MDGKDVFVLEPVAEKPDREIPQAHGGDAGQSGPQFMYSQSDEPEGDCEEDEQREEIGQPNGFHAHGRFQDHIDLIPHPVGGVAVGRNLEHADCETICTVVNCGFMSTTLPVCLTCSFIYLTFLVEMRASKGWARPV